MPTAFVFYCDAKYLDIFRSYLLLLVLNVFANMQNGFPNNPSSP